MSARSETSKTEMILILRVSPYYRSKAIATPASNSRSHSLTICFTYITHRKTFHAAAHLRSSLIPQAPLVPPRRLTFSSTVLRFLSGAILFRIPKLKRCVMKFQYAHTRLRRTTNRFSSEIICLFTLWSYFQSLPALPKLSYPHNFSSFDLWRFGSGLKAREFQTARQHG